MGSVISNAISAAKGLYLDAPLNAIKTVTGGVSAPEDNTAAILADDLAKRRATADAEAKALADKTAADKLAADEKAAADAAYLAFRRRASKSIYTSGQGDTSQASLGTKTLLGG